MHAFMLPAAPGRDAGLMAEPGDRATLLSLWHAPAQALADCKGLVLYLHPFAEEMNKTRRMAALQSRALARQGYGVLQIDLLGCGDSSGDFGDVSWNDWIDNVHAARCWLRERSSAPLTLWGLRAGCLLAAEAATRWADERCNFIFWQPTPNGAAVLRQFLRQAAAAAVLDGGGKGVVETLRRQLGEGHAVEVGGYRLHPALASGLDRARLALPAQIGHVNWFEVNAVATAISPAGVAAAVPWRAAAASFAAQIVSGPPFWQTTEIETAPALITATARALAELA